MPKKKLESQQQKQESREDLEVRAENLFLHFQMNEAQECIDHISEHVGRAVELFRRGHYDDADPIMALIDSRDYIENAIRRLGNFGSPSDLERINRLMPSPTDEDLPF